MGFVKEGQSLPMEEIISRAKQEAIDGWKGPVGEERAVKLDEFIRSRMKEYSEVLGHSEEDILNAVERRRNVNCVNWWQNANVPALADVTIYESREAFKKMNPTGLFVCPSCGGDSTDPQVCDSGKLMNKTEVCNWKSFGLFGTLGKGHNFLFKDTFLEDGIVFETFMPKALSGDTMK